MADSITRHSNDVNDRIAFIRTAPIVLWFVFLVSLPVHGGDSVPELMHAASWYPGPGNFEVIGDVISVTPGTGGAATVQFRTRPEWSSIGAGAIEERSTRRLEWEWPAGGGPVPVAVGMRNIFLQASASGEILRVSYLLGDLGGLRRMNGGRWEWVVEGGRSLFLLVVPRASEDTPIELRWTKRYGILLGRFEDGGYGDSGVQEIETAAMRNLGWPIANQPGLRVLPGRDGWRRWTLRAP